MAVRRLCCVSLVTCLLHVATGPTAQEAAVGVQDPGARFDAASSAARDGSGSWTVAARRFLQIVPESAAYRLRLVAGAEALVESGDAARAALLAEQRLREVPGDERALWVRWVAAVDGFGAGPAAFAALKDDWDAAPPAAIDRFLVTAIGRREGALYQAAGAALRHGEAEAALRVMRRGAALMEEYAAAGDDASMRRSAALMVTNEALAHRQLGSADAARARYARACELWPNDDITWSDRGLAAKVAGDLPEAMRCFAKSLELERSAGVGPAVTNLGVLARRDLDRVRDDLFALSAALRQRALDEQVDAAVRDGGLLDSDPVVGMLELAVEVRPQTELRRRLLVDAVVPRR